MNAPSDITLLLAIYAYSVTRRPIKRADCVVEEEENTSLVRSESHTQSPYPPSPKIALSFDIVEPSKPAPTTHEMKWVCFAPFFFPARNLKRAIQGDVC